MKKWLFAFMVLFSSSAFAAETRFFVNGLTCPFCARGIEKAFKKIDGFEVESVRIISLKTGEVVVKTKGDQPLPERIIRRELKETDFSLRSVVVPKEGAK